MRERRSSRIPLPPLLTVIAAALLSLTAIVGCQQEQTQAKAEADPPPATKTCTKLFGGARFCCAAGMRSTLPQPLKADPVGGFAIDGWCERDGKAVYPTLEWDDKITFACPDEAKPVPGRWDEDGLAGTELACTIADKPEGDYVRFWEKGARLQMGQYKAGVLEGAITRWHENGKVEAKGSFAAGLREGMWEFWDDAGNRIREDHYVGGKRNGRALAWWNNGKPRYEMDVVDDVIHGQWVEFWYNGNKKQECPRVNGVSECTYRAWWENGQLASEGERRGAENCGEWKCFKQDGTAQSCWGASEQASENFAKCKSTATGAACPKCPPPPKPTKAGKAG